MTDSSAPTRVALVTGAGQGIGQAIAQRLAKTGLAVVLCDLHRDKLEKSAQEIRDTGANTVAIVTDVSDEAAVGAMLEEVSKRFGRLDVLVNNAGISPKLNGRKPLVEQTPMSQWSQTLAVNLTGVFLLCRGAVPLMKQNKWGRIVNVSSIAGRRPSAQSSAMYAASKAGILGFSRVLAHEVGPDGITVNCVAPARINSPLAHLFAKSEELDKLYIAETPVRRIGTVADVAATVGFLASEEASYISGAILDITGGSYMP